MMVEFSSHQGGARTRRPREEEIGFELPKSDSRESKKTNDVFRQGVLGRLS
jgi:hypothetical protein